MSVAEPAQGGIGRESRPRALRTALVFRLSGQAYGIPLRRVKEILPMPLLAQAPGQPGILAGFLNLRGSAVPVVKLARLFGLAELPIGRYTPLIVLRLGASALAMIVDSVDGVVRFGEEMIVPISDNVCVNNCAQALVNLGERSFVLLADDRLLRQQELCCIEELTAIEQARLHELEGAVL